MAYHSSQVLTATVAHGESAAGASDAEVTMTPSASTKRIHILWIAVFSGGAAVKTWSILAGAAGATVILTGRSLVTDSVENPTVVHDLQGVPISDAGVACTVNLDDTTAGCQVTVAYFEM